MSSVYLACLVIGGGFALLSASGELVMRRTPEIERSGPAFALRALAWSVAAFGGAGLLLHRLDPGLSSGLRLVFAILAAWLVGGVVVTFLAFLGRSGPGELNETAGGNRS